MPTMVQLLEQVRERDESDRAYWRKRFRPSLDRLRNIQLRNGSLYTNFRAFIPVVVLAAVWFAVVDWRHMVGFSQLLNRSITIRHLILAVAVVSLWNVWLGFSVFDSRSAKRDVLREVARLTSASVACGCLLLVGNLARNQFHLGLALGLWMALALLVVSFGLLASFFIAAELSPLLLSKRPALIVGTGPRAQLLRARLESQYSPYELYGCMDDEYAGHDSEHDNYLGSLDNLADLLKNHPVEVVLIGLPVKSKYDEIQRVIDICETVGVESHYMQDVFETSRAQVQTKPQASHHFTVLSTLVHHPGLYLKRLFDLVGALALILIASPLMIAAGIAIKVSGPGPVLFVQQRYGRNRKRFPMFKFRSMVVDAEKRQAALESKNEAQGPVFKLKSDPRVTKVGAFLRKTSIDELPQLFNILRGEMSLVGPRPLPIRDVTRFEEARFLRRFSVRPGLTCLWQASGRSNTGFDDWIKQDLTYIDNWSLSLDFKILLMTIPAVLKGSGAV